MTRSARMTMAASQAWTCRALQGSRALLSSVAGRVTVGASAEEPSYELTAHDPRPHRTGRGDPGLGAVEVGADDRAVELLGRDARPGTAGSQRQVLPVAHVRLSGRHDGRWPAIADRRARQQVGELGRPPAGGGSSPPKGGDFQRWRAVRCGPGVQPPTHPLAARGPRRLTAATGAQSRTP